MFHANLVSTLTEAIYRFIRIGHESISIDLLLEIRWLILQNRLRILSADKLQLSNFYKIAKRSPDSYS